MTGKELIAGLFEEFFNNHDLNAIDKYMHPNYIQHDWDVPDGREGFREHFKRVFEVLPNFRVDVKHILEDGDMVVMHGYGVSDPSSLAIPGSCKSDEKGSVPASEQNLFLLLYYTNHSAFARRAKFFSNSC